MSEYKMNENIYQSLGYLEKCGHIKFKPDIPLEVLQEIRQIQILKYSLDKINMKLKPNNELSKRPLDSTIQLDPHNEVEKDENLMKLIHVFNLVEAVNLEEIQFFKDYCNSTLIMTVADVKFHQLEYIDFHNCNLGSLQFLSFLDTPQLKRLILKSNNITNLNSLAKVKFPKLFWIQLQDNQIQDAKGLNRSLLARRIAQLEVSQKFDRKLQDVFSYLTSWFFKLPFEHVNYVSNVIFNQGKQETGFLFRKKIQTKALKKYPDINFR